MPINLKSPPEAETVPVADAVALIAMVRENKVGMTVITGPLPKAFYDAIADLWAEVSRLRREEKVAEDRRQLLVRLAVNLAATNQWLHSFITERWKRRDLPMLRDRIEVLIKDVGQLSGSPASFEASASELAAIRATVGANAEARIEALKAEIVCLTERIAILQERIRDAQDDGRIAIAVGSVVSGLALLLLLALAASGPLPLAYLFYALARLALSASLGGAS